MSIEGLSSLTKKEINIFDFLILSLTDQWDTTRGEIHLGGNYEKLFIFTTSINKCHGRKF